MHKTKLILTLVIALALLAVPAAPAMAAGPTGGWSSGIACQNLDSSNAATVTLTFYREGSSTEAIQYSATIAAGGSRNWLTTSTPTMPGFPTNFTGAGVISSSTQLACNLNTQSTNVGSQSSPYRMGTASGFSEAQAGPVMYIPQVVKGVVGFQSYFAVQNTSTSDVNVNVKYYKSDGSEITAAAQSGLVKALSTKVFYTEDNAGLPTSFNGGAKVMAADGTTKLAVVVALYKGGANYGEAHFQSYNGVASGASKIYVPRFVRKLVGNNSGLTIQNVGTVATKIRVTFSFNGVNYPVTSPTDVKPGASWLLYAPSISALVPVDSQANRQGSAVVQALTTGALLAANVNEDNSVPTEIRYGQGSTYNAIPAGDESNTVFFPQFTKQVVNTFSSGFQVSNTTGTAGTCNIQYVAQPAINENNVPMPANGSITRWALSAASSAMRAMNPGYNAAVKVSCTVPVTGIVNMSAYGDKYGDSFTQTAGLNQ